ncbi:MAG: hypothetical protein HYZ53_05410 [Planctomycetes bacterium]|nr:hypothetical protein [Planctomycetota bacterium]
METLRNCALSIILLACATAVVGLWRAADLSSTTGTHGDGACASTVRSGEVGRLPAVPEGSPPAVAPARARSPLHSASRSQEQRDQAAPPRSSVAPGACVALAATAMDDDTAGSLVLGLEEAVSRTDLMSAGALARELSRMGKAARVSLGRARARCTSPELGAYLDYASGGPEPKREHAATPR